MSYKNPSPKHRSRLSTRVRTGVAAVAACFVTGSVLSNPLNPTVVNGTATFNQAGSVLTVTNSNGAIINWEKFSIRAGETTHFAQTAASSTVLNRVLNDPTAIYGTLSSNGRVWLVNPAGIMVGPGGRIDTAGFVASTLAIRNEDFLAGRHLFVNDGSAQNVINQGEIRTPAGGSVYLIGSNVANEGIITTPGGETILAAGATVSLIDSATPGVKVDIIGSAGNATNLGEITAEAGRVGIAGVIVRNSGQINASSAVSEGGRVFLKASQDAYVDGNGRIVTTGTKGGSVEVLGNRVAVTDNAEIDASGANGGGKILVGGDFQGKNPDVQNANVSYFGPDAGLKADATGVGAGGTVIVWADDTTRAYGSISARGGAAGGDGGLVETSGKRYLDAPGIRVDVGAGNGAGGTWLLDPSAIDIVASGTTTAPEVDGVFSYGGDVGTVLASDINSALGFYGSVVIHTAGAGSGSGDINAGGVTISGPGSLTLAAYGGDTATGNINIYGGSNINVGGGFKALAGWDGGGYLGSDVIAGKGDINISRSWIHSSSNIDLHAGNDITLGHTGADSAGTWIQSNGVMSVSATNLSLFGGYGGGVSMGISDWQGPGVMLRGDAGQTIEVVNQILLQAGNINNTAYAGSPMHGGSVAIESGGSQDISASTIKLYAGASGHDNGAQIQAYGGQAITLYGGSLDVIGGGDNSASVYGGAGSFNNQARIQHGVWQPGNTMTGYDSQSITVYGGGTVTVQAGNGTGVLGYYGSDCAGPSGTYADACRGSSNTASIDNGVGNQTLAFTAGGSLAVTGGTSGSQNWAGIENKGSGQYITGNPDITLTGGSSGGRMVYGYSGVDHLSNDAGIFSQGVDDGQVINAGTLTIYGGGATFGGAGISSESGQPLDIHVAGNLSMYGGSSTAGDPLASAVFIGSDAAAQITIDVGGDVYIKSGSAGSGAAVIGSIGGAANVNLSTAAGRDITIIADASPVGIGSMETGYGASVIINSGRDLITSGSGVMIGSTYNYQSPTSVILNAARDISLGSGTFVGVDSPSPGYSGSSFIKLVAGAVGVDGAAMPNLSASYGSVIATGASFRTGGGSFTALASDNVSLGDVSTAAPMNSGSSGGLVTVTAYNGTIDVASISSRGADGGEGSAGSGGGVDIWAYGGVTIGTGGIDASGGDAGYGGWGTWGGAGGEVSITSQSGIVAVNGNILAKGGQGGSGTTGSSGFWSTEWLGVGDLFDYGYGYGYGYPSSTYSAPISSGAGGQGGEGGSILLTASGIGGGVQLGSVLLDVTGGRGGEGGAGYSGYSSAQSGGSGGWGGQGGFIDLSAPGTNGSISLGSVQLKAAGGEGGLGGHGGFVYGYAATGAKGGSGGQGGYGGSVTLSAGGQDGLIEIGAAQVYVDGGNGGKGGYGGDTYYFGYAGSGGMGGNGDSAGSITLTGGTGGISISGALFSARGGNAMVGGDSGQGYYGGMTGGGGMSAGAGGTIVMNSGSAIDLALVQIDAYGGDAVSGGGGGTVNMLADGGLTLGSGMITVSGGNASLSGGDGGEGGGWGGQGGGGGMVMLASQTGNVTVYGAIVANGGIGGAGSQGYDDTNYGGWVSGGTGGWGGSGGQGGNINLNAALGSVVLGSGVSLSANGGEGGTGGTGGSGTGLGGYYYNGYSWVASGGYGQGGTGGQGGQGGQGGIINLQGGSIMATGGASVEANGGSGGDAGVGGNGYGNSYSYGGYPGSAWAGSGGTGGTGGYGGVVSLGSSSGDITIVGGTLRARGGTGGDGNAAGAAYLDGSIQSGYGGYAGSGGDGGNYYYSAGQISLTSHGDIAISGLVDARGGDGGSGEYGGDAGFGGNVMMVAGSIGGNGTTGTTGSIVGGGVSVSTGGGGFTALAGDSITLGSINTDGADRTYGYSAGAVSMNAAYGSIEVTSISAQGGDSVSPDYYYSGGAGASGGGVNLQSYGGLIIGSGGINTSGGVGGDGSHGGGGGGGSAGPVTLTSVTDEIKINGNITARGGDGGDSGGYSYFGNGSGGSGAAITLSSYGGITMTGRTIDVSGGDSGDLAYGYPGSGGMGGSIQMVANGTGAISLNGSSLISKGGDGGNNSGWGEAAGGGAGGSVSLSAYGGITGGSIDTSGGNGGHGLDGGEGGGAMGGSGGGAGSINLMTTTGNIDYSAGGVVIAANGGSGGYSVAGDGGEGGSAGMVMLGAPSGSLLLGNAQLSANAGDGGNANTGGYMMGYTWAGSAGSAGSVSLGAYGGISMTGGSISAIGGNGGSTGYGYAGYSSGGGMIQLNSAGTIALSGSSLSARGGFGGFGWDYGTDGASGGFIGISSNILGDISLIGTTLNVQGGDGRKGLDWGYVGGYGGDGGSVSLTTNSGSIMLSSGSFIYAGGGSAGAGANDDPYNEYAAGFGGDGGQGGTVTLGASGAMAGISMSGSAITASGGDGGDGGTGTGAYDGYGGDGGWGGSGGSVSLFAEGGIQSASVYVGGGSAGAGGSGVYGAGVAGDIGSGGGVQLTSFTGGSAGGLAIGAAVVGADSLTAMASGTYGGISLSNQGLQPTTLSVVDSTSQQSNINFFNSGDLTLDGSQTFSTGPYGSTQIGSGGLLNVAAAMGGYDVNLAGATVNVDAAISAVNNINLGGGALNVNANMTAGNNIQLGATTISINAAGLVAADNNATLLAPLTGGTIYLNGGGVTAKGLAATPSSITASNGATVSYTGIGFVAGNLFADAGGYLNATDTTIGNISGLVAENITLNNGAYFRAGKDVDLVLAGTGSTFSLLNGGYTVASPTTVRIEFTTRTSGGIVGIENITPAPIVKYGAATVVVDPCVTNPLLCKPAEPKPPTETTTPVIETAKLDPTLPKLDSTGSTTGGTEGTFGDTGGDQQASDKKDEKDEKEKKEKKSDQAKDEKKDEKPAQKKVAQCT